METCEETSDHIHNADPDYTPDKFSVTTRTCAATAIIMTGVKNASKTISYFTKFERLFIIKLDAIAYTYPWFVYYYKIILNSV